MKLTNKYKLPSSFVKVIESSLYDITKSDPKRIGITTLINPPLQRILKVNHWDEMEEDVSDYIWLILGTAAHHFVEKSAGEESLSEEKIVQEIDGITVVAKLDNYHFDDERITDWKVTSVWCVKLGDKIDWERQLNCYAYMLRKKGLPVEKLTINAVLKDWRKLEKLKYDDYPNVPFQEISIKLWTFEEQEKYIKERVKIFKEQLELKEEEVPVCDPESRWAKENTYAVYKGTLKKASRVLGSKEDALDWAQANIGEKGFKIQERKGEDVKCMNYCDVSSFCPYFKIKYGTKK